MKKIMISGVASCLFCLGVAAQEDTTSRNRDTTGNKTDTTGIRSDTSAKSISSDNNTAYAPITKVGKLSVTAFNTINQKGSKMVAAIKPTKAALSAADKKLLMQVAAGGQRQLAISQAVLDKVTNPQVKLLAASEVEEQTGLKAKLQEIASAKGITLPDAPESGTQDIMTQTQNMSDGGFDAFYLTEGGIKGHELLQKTMMKVSATAKDPALKKLAAATLPVIRTHLTVSKDVRSSIGSSGTQAMK